MQAKHKDDELSTLVIVSAIFTVFLLFIDFGYSDWNGMFQYWWAATLAILLHITAVGLWIVEIVKWKDPNYDNYRLALFITLLSTSILVGGFRVVKNEGQMFNKDVDKAKQEQPK